MKNSTSTTAVQPSHAADWLLAATRESRKELHHVGGTEVSNVHRDDMQPPPMNSTLNSNSSLAAEATATPAQRLKESFLEYLRRGEDQVDWAAGQSVREALWMVDDGEGLLKGLYQRYVLSAKATSAGSETALCVGRLKALALLHFLLNQGPPYMLELIMELCPRIVPEAAASRGPAGAAGRELRGACEHYAEYLVRKYVVTKEEGHLLGNHSLDLAELRRRFASSNPQAYGREDTARMLALLGEVLEMGDTLTKLGVEISKLFPFEYGIAVLFRPVLDEVRYLYELVQHYSLRLISAVSMALRTRIDQLVARLKSLLETIALHPDYTNARAVISKYDDVFLL